MLILKFGGSSVSNSERIRCVGTIVQSTQKSNSEKIVVVVSALHGVTDALLNCTKLAQTSSAELAQSLATLSERHFTLVRELLPIERQSKLIAAVKVLCNELEELLHGISLVRESSPRLLDLVASFGERLSALIVSEYLNSRNIEADFVDAREILIASGDFGNSRVDETASAPRVTDRLGGDARIVPVVSGFIAATKNGDTVTLGRGGSDYTASVLGALLNAREIQIWTDVDGFLTADPRKVERAFTIPHLSYDEAMELSHSGARVIYPPTIQPAFAKSVPIRVMNSFKPDGQTSLIGGGEPSHQTMITGISSISRVCLIRIQGSGMVGVSGTARRVFSALAENRTNVILISQASSEHSICVAINPDDSESAKLALNKELSHEIAQGDVEPPSIESELAIISVVGENMRHRAGISGTLFSSLGKAGINVVAIAQGSSELSISVVIRSTDETKALNVIHDAFFLSDERVVKIFMLGAGLVATALLNQISKQRNHLRAHLGLDLRLCGVGNSRQMLFAEKGLELESVGASLENAKETMNFETFVARAKEQTISKTVFVDCTANEDVARSYATVLSSSIPVVTANKRAQSGDLELFKEMKKAALARRVQFLFETSVGAGLPVISTLNDLVRSGDRILRIEGVLSGTLSFIFSQFGTSTKFSELVTKARELGYTEPDPRDDLNGVDVARKILILAREAGINASMEDVDVENLVPEELRALPTSEQFLEALPKFDEEFARKALAAAKQNRKLRYVATLELPHESEKAKLSVKLLAVTEDHPFWSLDGSDNIFAFTTERYSKRPLVVRGPGAGAEVTAAGVFADIIRAAQ